MNTDFQFELTSEPNSRNSYEYYTFGKNFVDTLDTHAPKKRKILLGNRKPHVNKTLNSAIMKCSQLKTKAMKSKSKNDMIKYKKRHNLVVKLKNVAKKDFLTILK